MTEAQGGGFEDKLIKRKNFEQCLAILKDRQTKEEARVKKVNDLRAKMKEIEAGTKKVTDFGADTDQELLKYLEDPELLKRMEAEAKEIESQGYNSDGYYEKKLLVRSRLRASLVGPSINADKDDRADQSLGGLIDNKKDD